MANNEKKTTTFLEKIGQIPRFWIYLGLLVILMLPLILRVKAKPRMGMETKMVYDFIDSLPPGSVIMLSFTYGPSARPELEPMALAIMRHAYMRGIRVMGMTLSVEGTGLGLEAMTRVAKEFEEAGYPLTYGEDWVYLGYKTGWAMVIRGIGGDFHETFPRDYYGNDTRKMALTRDIQNYDDIALVIDFASGGSPGSWITYAYQQFDQKVAAGVTAVMGADWQPYIRTGQLVWMLNGMKAAADYEAKTIEMMEKRFGYTPKPYATVGIVSVTWAQIYLIILIIIGNISFFALRRRRRR